LADADLHKLLADPGKKKKNKKSSPQPRSPLPPPTLTNAQFSACVLFSCLFSFSPGIWEYTLQYEVFPLNNLLCAVLLLLTTSYLQTPSPLTCVLGGLFTGLCMTNQHTSSIYIFVCVLSILSLDNFRLLLRDRRTLLLTACSTLLGLSPYLYLVVRANAKAVDGWGDQRTLRGFLTHFLREEYGTFVLASEWESGEAQDSSK
jgi:hypothetical protein